jgi:hypothetical protein
MSNKKVLSVYLEDATQQQLKFLELQTSIPQAAHIRNALNAYFSLVQEYGISYIFDASRLTQETYAQYYGKIKEPPKPELLCNPDPDLEAKPEKPAVKTSIKSKDMGTVIHKQA